MLVKLIILLGSKEEPNETAGCIKKKQCSHWVRYDFVIYVCISLIHSLCQRGQLDNKCMVHACSSVHLCIQVYMHILADHVTLSIN